MSAVCVRLGGFVRKESISLDFSIDGLRGLGVKVGS